MTLKELIAADARAIILNTDELASEHDIDGVTVKAVVTDDEEGELVGDLQDMVFIAKKRVQVQETDLAKTPVVGKRLYLDQQPYTVLNISRGIGGWIVILLNQHAAR